jgi:hypothetical protein
MGQEERAVVPGSLPAGRVLAVDERGIGLRMTWRLDRGFINLSLWRADRCVETFHLTPTDASRLVTFIVNGLAETASTQPAGSVSHLELRRPEPVRELLSKAERRLRFGLARTLRAAAEAIQGPTR